jgi:hypothetical protein
MTRYLLVVVVVGKFRDLPTEVLALATPESPIDFARHDRPVTADGMK